MEIMQVVSSSTHMRLYIEIFISVHISLNELSLDARGMGNCSHFHIFSLYREREVLKIFMHKIKKIIIMQKVSCA